MWEFFRSIAQLLKVPLILRFASTPSLVVTEALAHTSDLRGDIRGAAMLKKNEVRYLIWESRESQWGWDNFNLRVSFINPCFSRPPTSTPHSHSPSNSISVWIREIVGVTGQQKLQGGGEDEYVKDLICFFYVSSHLLHLMCTSYYCKAFLEHCCDWCESCKSNNQTKTAWRGGSQCGSNGAVGLR